MYLQEKTTTVFNLADKGMKEKNRGMLDTFKILAGILDETEPLFYKLVHDHLS